MKLKNELILFLLLCFFASPGISQRRLDSLLTLLNNHKKEDTIKLRMLNDAAKEYQYSNVAKGKALADLAIALAQKLNQKNSEATAYLIKGENCFRESNDKEAISCLQKAKSIFESTSNKLGIASSFTDLGNVNNLESNFREAIDNYQKALELNEQMKNQTGIEADLGNIGTAYKGLSEYDKAIDYLNKALIIGEAVGNKRQMLNVLISIGEIDLDLSKYPEAINVFQKSLGFAGQLHDSISSANILVKLGQVYIDFGDYKKGIEFFQESLNMSIAISDSIEIASVYYGLSTYYAGINDYNKSIDYSKKALELCEKLDRLGMVPSLYNNIGFEYYSLQQYSKVLMYYNKGLDMAIKLGKKDDQALLLLSMGEFYRDATDSALIQSGLNPTNRYDTAIACFIKAKDEAKVNGNLMWQRYAWDDLNQTYERQKDYIHSLGAYKNFIILRDSIINDTKRKEINRLTLSYEFSKREDSIKLQQRTTESQLIAKQQELTINRNALALTNKENDLQKLAYLKTQADLQNEQLEKQKDEKQLTITVKEKQLQLANVKSLTQEKHLNELKQQQQWIYIIGSLLLLGLGVSYFFYRSRLKENRLKTEIATEKIRQQQKEAAFQRNLADISLTALRSQMNPHFIFNCLNSIKLYTSQNDTTAAVEYLTKFSKLIRLVMENSRNDRISLASELQALRLYIEMEAMRFKEKLKYSINVENNVETDYIEIPPLLLQPYVENAIWHGLMHKEEGGKIDIDVVMHTTESLIQVSITDNGIGRAKSLELKSKTAIKHKSYGMKVTSERIALINHIYKAGANVTIHDLKDAHGNPNGTRVIIQIPV